jgi:hypothetical protein
MMTIATSILLASRIFSLKTAKQSSPASPDSVKPHSWRIAARFTAIQRVMRVNQGNQKAQLALCVR